MKEIGKFLKENRVKLGLSIADISDITKMNINIIRNIEEGNVAYFSNDLTYLRYYIKSYSNAVNVDFDSIEQELDKTTLAYTQSIQTLEDEKIVKLNENIKVKRKQAGSAPSHGGIKRVRKSVDWTLVSLITIVTLIVAFLVYSVVVNLTSDGKVDDKPPVTDVVPPADDEDDPDQEEPGDQEPIIEAVKVTKEDPSTYLISNWQNQKEFSIKTIFGVNTWTQIKVNDQVINIPDENVNSKTYTPGDELVINDKYTLNDQEVEFSAGDKIEIRYGIMRGNKFMINNEDYLLDESIANVNSGTSITFKLDADVD